MRVVLAITLVLVAALLPSAHAENNYVYGISKKDWYTWRDLGLAISNITATGCQNQVEATYMEADDLLSSRGLSSAFLSSLQNISFVSGDIEESSDFRTKLQAAIDYFAVAATSKRMKKWGWSGATSDPEATATADIKVGGLLVTAAGSSSLGAAPAAFLLAVAAAVAVPVMVKRL